MNEEGFMFFIFDHIDSCKKVIDRGPWYVGGILLILKQWHRMMKLTKEALTEIPVWVKFYNVPMEFWSTDGLSRIASAIGVPRFMDQLTSFGTRVSFARVCVDIKAESPLPDSFFIQCEGVKVEIRVEYQGVPVSCSHCGVFGHETKACVSAQVSHLIELQKATETNLGEDEGWKTVKDKGKRKAGENLTPVVATQSEVNENRADVELKVSLHAPDPVTTSHSMIHQIASLVSPAASENLEEVEADMQVVTPLKPSGSNEIEDFGPQQKYKGVETPLQGKKASGKTGSQKKKKR
ncbi:uncharacterized protein LOC114262494 [Camellia sinensis]|uniref:uncharacterized protein LOC114262494 n=1 Tax=Camellia sinensis TaxID=4442 RepID=UPI0010358FB5|nr:uncharacterized protein LOC114262494 [Camellia sinensis]